MNRTLLLIILAVIIVIGVLFGVAYVMYRPSVSQTATSTPVTFPSSGTSTTTSSVGTGGVVIYAKDGSSLRVPNFTKDAPSQQVSSVQDDVQYTLTPYPEYVPGQPYPTHSFDVAFNQIGSQFLISLNQEPIGAARTDAESFLRSTLQLTDTQLCSLNTLVTVGDDVNAQYSAINLGLSFCPGAVPLPQ